MRIIAGEFRGRRIRTPADKRVRPTGERVREALFSILNPALPDADVVDLFAGSGALGLEALSRGARHATFVDIGKASLAAVRGNIAALGVEPRTHVERADALRFAAELESMAYDVALADPPYATDGASQLVALFRVTPFARILGVEHRSAVAIAGDETRRYGDAALTLCYAP